MKRLLLLTASISLLILTGCATYRTQTTGRPVDETWLEQIVPGATTKEYVLKSLGEPTDVKKGYDTETLVYVYKETRVPSYLGGFVEYRPGRATRKTVLEITVRNGTVTGYRFNRYEK